MLLLIRRVGREGISGCDWRCGGVYYVDVSILCLKLDEIYSRTLTMIRNIDDLDEKILSRMGEITSIIC